MDPLLEDGIVDGVESGIATLLALEPFIADDKAAEQLAWIKNLCTENVGL